MPQSVPRRAHCLPLMGYRHMYRSLLRFFSLPRQEALSLLYALYIGNLDTCHYEGVPPQVTELTAEGFCSLVSVYARPYHTEVQMYRSMHALLRSIRYEATIQDTRRAISRFRILAGTLENRFEDTYDCDITDPKTTYALCWSRLTVRREEPLTALREGANF